MPLIEDLVASVSDVEAQVSNITVGPIWTLVVVTGARAGPGAGGALGETTGCGLAPNAGCMSGQAASTLAETAKEYLNRPLQDVLRLALSTDRAERIVGIAGLNAALTAGSDEGRFRARSISRGLGKSIAVVGDFEFIDNLRSIAGKVACIPKPEGPEARLDKTAEDAIRSADLAILSGALLVDGTLGYLLDLARSCYAMITGLSTPLSPVLFDYGADQLVGTRIRDAESAILCVSKGLEDLSGCSCLRPAVLSRRE